MKMFKKVLTSLFLVSLMAAGATACDIPGTSDGASDSSSASEVVTPTTYTLSLTANKTTATIGDKVTLTATLLADGEAVEEDDFEYEIIDGAAYATLKDNVLTISSSAKANAVIKVWAKSGATKSDILSITVDIPLESVSASANNGITNVESGGLVILNKTVTPSNADASAFEWVILEGSDLCSLSGDILSVNAGVATGSTISVQGKIGDMTTDVLTFTVGYPVESITVSADKTENVLCGEKVILSKTPTPTNADLSTFEWVILEGADACSLSGNVLTVNAGVTTGTQIKVQGKAGDVVSENTITISVGYPVTSVSVSADAANILSGSSINLSKEILPAQANVSTFEWEIVEGEDVCSISGDKLTVKEGVATGVQIKVQGTIEGKTSNVLVFTVGYPVTALNVLFSGSTNIPNGSSIDLTVAPIPSNATNADYVWAFVEGEEYASIVNNRLTVSDDTPLGAEIKFYAEGAVDSEVITITVGIPIETLAISSNAPANLVKGESYNVSLTATPADANTKNVAWVVNDEAKAYVTIADGVMTVAANTPTGTPVQVKATSGNIESNTLSYVVGIVLQSIDTTMIGATNVNPGDVRALNVSLSPANATDQDYVWAFSAGADACTIENNVLTVKDDAAIGTTITFYAQVGSVTSAPITIIVGTPITGITISADKDEIVRGESATLSVTLNPTNTNEGYTWVVSGSAFASVVDGKLVINNTPEAIGEVVKVKAVSLSGVVESNELTFLVLGTQDDIDVNYELVPTDDTIDVDIYESGTAPTLTAEVYYQGNEIENPVLTYKIVDGNEYLSISTVNNVCTFTAKGHGFAQVEVRIEGTNVIETININVIVPPDILTLPEVFTGVRTNYAYNFSMADALPYAVSPIGTNVCQDINYTFQTADRTTGDEVATYADGKITFKKTGAITVTATSASGSDKEASVSYTFNINDGINVYSFEELKETLQSNAYTGDKAVNLIALDKVDGEYKYVPDVVGNESFATLMNKDLKAGIFIYGKGAIINGNHHPIDISGLRALTKTEMEEGNVSVGDAADAGYFTKCLFEFLPKNGDSTTYKIKLTDLELRGNTPVDFEGDIVEGTAKPIGVALAGIKIGSTGIHTDSAGNITEDYTKGKYSLDMKNIRVTGFNHGLNITHAVDGMIDTVYTGNCYSDGILCRASILTLRNVTFGVCGACGIEFAPERSNMAGVNEDQNQTITIDGTIDGSKNWHGASDTRYFANYTLMGNRVADIVASVVAGYNSANPNITAHIQKTSGEFCFVALQFYDLSTPDPSTPSDMFSHTNPTVINYPSHLAGGIVNVADLPAPGTLDTTHQYIRMPIIVPISGVGDQQVGVALFYNVHYAG